MRRRYTALTSAILCLSLCTGCGSAPAVTQQFEPLDPEALREIDTPYIGIVLKSLEGQFYPLIKAGAEAEANRLGAEVIVVAPEEENDANEQAELLGIMAGMALDVIAVASCDEATLDSSLELAHSNGKYILAVDEPLSSALCECYVGTDDLTVGKRQAAYAANVARSDTAVILRGSENSPNHNTRVQGLKQRLYQSGIRVTACVDCGSSRTAAYEQTAKLLESDPDIGVICATNDDMAVGAQQAVSTQGSEVPIVSIDGTMEVVQSVLDGEIAGVVDQDAYEIGVRTVDAAVRLYAGESIADDYVPAQIITQRTAQNALDVLNRRIEEYDD